MADIQQDSAFVDLFGQERTDLVEGGTLDKRFIVSPFSVLDARKGRWQDRKRAWIAIGVKGEEGRQDIDGANNICSEKWGRGAESEFYDKNPARCGGHGLSEGQERINATLTKYDQQKKSKDAVPGGGGPKSVRRLAAKDAGRCFGQDIMKGEHVVGVNVAADKGYSYAAQENGALDEATQRNLGVYAAPGGVTVMRGNGRGTPMEAGLAFGEVPSYDGGNRSVAGTSVFDPVLCECMYKWFAPKEGKILDPFAGESTKGIVAGYLDYRYFGVELRPEQVKANYKQAELVQAKAAGNKETMSPPTWIQGDSSKLGEVLDTFDPFSDGYDFIWTSPPYYDLEIYSESEKDGSAFETYDKFMVWYEEIFRQAVERLKPNRFLAVKVGEIRDEKGEYRNFVGDNITVFKRLGLRYYNEIILVTAVGSLPVRISSQFPSYRKIGKTHQNILLFYKGESFKRIPAELGSLVMSDVLEPGDLATLNTAAADEILHPEKVRKPKAVPPPPARILRPAPKA
jgi:DNA modification methylase